MKNVLRWKEVVLKVILNKGKDKSKPCLQRFASYSTAVYLAVYEQRSDKDQYAKYDHSCFGIRTSNQAERRCKCITALKIPVRNKVSSIFLYPRKRVGNC